MSLKTKHYKKPRAEAIILLDGDIMAFSPEGSIGEWDPQNANMRADECAGGGAYTI